MEKVYQEYSKFIEKCARNYLEKTGAPKDLYDDIHSEATIAFLEVCRKFGIKKAPLDPIVVSYIKNAMRTAMRKCVWQHYNMKSGVSRKIDHRRNAKFPEEMYFDADFSAPEAEDILRMFTPTEKAIITLKLAGYKNADIAQERAVTPSAVSNALQNMRRKAQKGLSA